MVSGRSGGSAGLTPIVLSEEQQRRLREVGAQVSDYSTQESRERELKSNPLLAYSLGELVTQMLILYSQDPNVARPEADVPAESRENYTSYRRLVAELDRREQIFRRVPLRDMVFRR